MSKRWWFVKTIFGSDDKSTLKKVDWKFMLFYVDGVIDSRVTNKDWWQII